MSLNLSENIGRYYISHKKNLQIQLIATSNKHAAFVHWQTLLKSIDHNLFIFIPSNYLRKHNMFSIMLRGRGSKISFRIWFDACKTIP